MFEIRLDGVERVEKRLNDMIAKVDHAKRVDIGNELGDWQVDDMHRDAPFVMRSRARGRATTVIRPHSLYEMKGSRGYQRRMIRRVGTGTKRAAAAWTRWQARWSQRPILRATMYARLVERMREMLAEKFKW